MVTESLVANHSWSDAWAAAAQNAIDRLAAWNGRDPSRYVTAAQGSHLRWRDACSDLDHFR